MPVKIKKVKGGYQVATPMMIHARKATKANAIKQMRFLNAIEHGFKSKRK